MTTIIDYGVGNIGSIANMLKKVGEESVITSDIGIIDKAQKLILCGIGAFDDGMTKLNNMGIIDTLKRKVLEEKIPINYLLKAVKRDNCPAWALSRQQRKNLNFPANRRMAGDLKSLIWVGTS
jgi:hypothetical protein